MAALLDRLAAGDPIGERVALVVAHPDDEVAGMGARLAQLPRLRLVHLTDGAPADGADARRAGFADPADYAEARRRELARALFRTGAGGADRRCYRLPDGDAHAHLETVVTRLADDLAGIDAVFTHPYEHGHPDHDTAALGVALACARLGEAAPQRYEFASYHLAGDRAVFGAFWRDEAAAEAEVTLADHEQARKSAALDCFATQAEVLAQFPRDVERFRSAPAYRFDAPAPPGAALYERWGLPARAEDWRARAAAMLGGS